MSLELELWAMNSARISELEAGGGGGGSSYTKSEIDEMLLDKVDAVEGKGLSTNDYSDADKSNVDNIPVLQENLTELSNTVSEIGKLKIAKINAYFDSNGTYTFSGHNINNCVPINVYGNKNNNNYRYFIDSDLSGNFFITATDFLTYSKLTNFSAKIIIAYYEKII